MCEFCHPMLYLLLLTYGTIFLTEIVGDKTIYTVCSLSTRFHFVPVFSGILIAFIGKMLIAVMAGQLFAELSTRLVTATSAATFFIMAFVIWRKKPESEPVEREARSYSSRALLIPFAAIFFSEWGDSGQIAAAALTARFHAPMIIWLGATLALATKGVLAMTLGLSLRKRVPKNILRSVTVALCITMGIVSALRWWV
jgi:putative Ca2+/H+ antiporter (TMEM165/GDT1 family)